MTKFIFYSLFFLIISACSPSISVSVQEVEEGWHQLRTYKFVHPDKIPEANFTFTDEEKHVLFSAVSDQLSKRAYESIKDAALIIKIQGGRFQYSKAGSTSDNLYYNPYLYNQGVNLRDNSVKEIQLIIEIYDAKTRSIYWWGTASDDADDQQQLIEMVAAIFDKFPVPPKE